MSCVSDGGQKNGNKECLTTLKLWMHARIKMILKQTHHKNLEHIGFQKEKAKLLLYVS